MISQNPKNQLSKTYSNDDIRKRSVWVLTQKGNLKFLVGFNVNVLWDETIKFYYCGQNFSRAYKIELLKREGFRMKRFKLLEINNGNFDKENKPDE